MYSAHIRAAPVLKPSDVPFSGSASLVPESTPVTSRVPSAIHSLLQYRECNHPSVWPAEGFCEASSRLIGRMKLSGLTARTEHPTRRNTVSAVFPNIRPGTPVRTTVPITIRLTSRVVANSLPIQHPHDQCTREMTVREVVTGNGRYLVSGAGYEPRGAFHPRNSGSRDHGAAIDPRDRPDLMRALHIAAWCNTAQDFPHPESEGSWQVIGDPTEGRWSSPHSRRTSKCTIVAIACSTNFPSTPNGGPCRSWSCAGRLDQNVHQGSTRGHSGQVRQGVAARPDRASDTRTAS